MPRPGQAKVGVWYFYVVLDGVGRHRIIATGGSWLVEVLRGYKGVVPTPTLRWPGRYRARREYSVYVREVTTGREAYLDGGIARVVAERIEALMPFIRRAPGGVLTLPEAAAPVQELLSALSRVRLE